MSGGAAQSSRPVRVLLLIDSLESQAGTENQVFELVRRMDRQRVEVVVGCVEDSARFQGLARYAELVLFPVKRVFSPTGLKQILRLRREVNARSIDVVHAMFGRSIVMGVFGGFFSRATAVVTSRRNLGYWFAGEPFYLWIYRLLNRMSTRVLVNSEKTREVTARNEWVPADRVDVLYNGVDMERFTQAPVPSVREKLGLPQGAPVVGIVANYRPVKDLPMFLRAAQRVAQRVPEAVFVLVGRGSMKEELERLAQELGIRGRVIFTDDQGDVARLLPWLTVGCLTSNSESFSNSILEYMAAGLPVVATDVGGVAEAVEDQRTGFVVPIGDAPAFAEAVIRLLEDPSLRAKMGAYARRRCQERFSWEAAVRQHEDYYRNLVTAR